MAAGESIYAGDAGSAARDEEVAKLSRAAAAGAEARGRRRRLALALVAAVLALAWWARPQSGAQIAPAAEDMANNESLSVWLGNGCFWHTQYDMVTAEQAPPFSRNFAQVTALVGYAGGLFTSEEGLVCYHGGPSGSLYEDLGHAEAVQVELDPGHQRAQFASLLDKYFESFRSTSDGMQRLGECSNGRLGLSVALASDGRPLLRTDPADRGAPYRNVIGIPGGMSGKLFSTIGQHNLHDMPLVEGGDEGGRGDTVDNYQVYVYDSSVYHFYRAEAYHQVSTHPPAESPLVSHRPWETGARPGSAVFSA